MKLLESSRHSVVQLACFFTRGIQLRSMGGLPAPDFSAQLCHPIIEAHAIASAALSPIGAPSAAHARTRNARLKHRLTTGRIS